MCLQANGLEPISYILVKDVVLGETTLKEHKVYRATTRENVIARLS